MRSHSFDWSQSDLVLLGHVYSQLLIKEELVPLAGLSEQDYPLAACLAYLLK